MSVDIYSPTTGDDLSPDELALYHLINDYRVSNGFDPIALSASLTLTAGRHALDTLYNIWDAGLQLPSGAGLHSWSDAPYYDDHSDPDVMWYAPDRLGTGYSTASYEISAAGFATVQDAMTGWMGSTPHNDVILNLGNWASQDFNAIGIGVEDDPSVTDYSGKIYHVWFGTVLDPAGTAAVQGDAGDNALLGTVFDDTLYGNAGADDLSGGLGNDILFGGAGTDTLNGGDGDDQLFVDGAWDVVDGGTGTDRVRFETAAGLSLDLSQWANIERVDGAAGDDSLDGSAVLTALVLLGNGGADTLTGGAESDQLQGGDGDDILNGGAKQDFLFGDAGADTLIGGTGNDYAYVDDPGDVVDGGGGTDRVRVQNVAGLAIDMSTWSGVERVDGDAGDDILDGSTFTSGLVLLGNGGADTLTGGAGNDVIFGNAGADTLAGNGGTDVLVGGTGVDVFSGGAGDDVIFVDDSGETVVDGGTGLDRARVEAGIVGIALDISGWTGIERVTLTAGDDVVTAAGSTEDLGLNGQDGADTLTGGSGSDLIFGGADNDTLSGGGGQDFLFGGTGADLFDGGSGDDFFYLDDSGDRVVDGGAGNDRAVLVKAGLSISVDGSWAGLERIDGVAGAEVIDATGYGTSLTILGNAGSDTLTGGLADDVIFGHAGADTLSGGAGGNDVLLGGGPDGFVDTFVFADGAGTDRINDWEDGFDLLDVTAITGVTGFADVTVDQSSGTNTVITAAAETIILQGFIGTIDQNDFV